MLFARCRSVAVHKLSGHYGIHHCSLLIGVQANNINKCRFDSFSNNSQKPERHELDIFPLSKRSFMVKCLKNNDSDSAISLFEELLRINDDKNILELQQMLILCHKKEHLPLTLRFVEKLTQLNVSRTEVVLIALIRCFCDASRVDDALNVLENMRKTSIVPRLRSAHPILEAACRADDLDMVVRILHLTQLLGIDLQADQLTLILETAVRNRTKLKAGSDFKMSVDRILHCCGNHLLGITFADMLQIVGNDIRINGDPSQALGVLTEQLSDIRGQVMSDALLRSHGEVTALTTSYDSGVVSTVAGALPRQQNANSSAPLLCGGDGSHLVTERFLVLSELRRIHGDDSLARLSITGRQARVVDIAASTGECPNCHTALQKLTLTEGEKSSVREALKRISPAMERQLDAFSAWLSDREEFAYFVDAPNVAYSGQNVADGRFSFSQVEIVVDQLLKRGQRVLVILPQSYTMRRIPNSLLGGSATSPLTDDDQRVLNRLRRADMLYEVPRGALDDWFWIYATLYEGRRSQAAVVTNDLTRDHKVAFPEPRTFMRWRTNHVVYYTFTRSFVRGEAVARGKRRGKEWESGDADVVSTLDGAPAKRRGQPSRSSVQVHLHGPSDFSREIQHSGDRWHIPAVDRSHWLCVKTH